MRTRAERACVWVVDDVATDAELARSALAERYDIALFRDGPSVLDQLARGDLPDAIVLDWVMPDLSGVEVVRFLRSSGRLRLEELKVLLLTAQNHPEQVAEALEAGADDYLAKPFAPIELKARVGSLVRSIRLAERIRSAERTIRQLIEQAPDALVAVDRAGRITWVNQEAEGLVGVPAGELVRRPLSEVLPQLDWRRARDGRPLADLVFEGRFYAPTARVVDDESLSGTVIALRDVTEKRHAEERRLDFYSIIAHDLRSPLQNVVVRSQLIARGRFGALDPQILFELQRIGESGREMVSLIDDFLEIARFESLSTRLAQEPVDLCALAAQLTVEYGPSVRLQGLTVRSECPKAPVLAVGDRRRLRQVVVNLLTNAIKFTPSGGQVVIVVRAEGDEVVFEVRDTGRGIPAEVKERLFRRYERHHEVDGVRGTGLGLMIVREIVDAHGGSVEVQSELGVGSVFRVRLPAHAAGLATA